MGWDGMGWVSGISDLCLGDAFVCCLEVAGILWAGGRTAGRWPTKVSLSPRKVQVMLM